MGYGGLKCSQQLGDVIVGPKSLKSVDHLIACLLYAQIKISHFLTDVLFCTSILDMLTINEISPEIVSEIVSHLPLTSLVRALGVSRRWRATPLLPPIHPIRQSLYNLFLEALCSPGLAKAQHWIDLHLTSFDREHYVACLRQQYDCIPPEFEMWILEWPARAAIGFVWPGLPKYFREEFGWERRYGCNHLASFPPILFRLCVRHLEYSRQIYDTPILVIWSGFNDYCASFLLMDQRPSLRGTVFFSAEGEGLATPESGDGPEENRLSLTAEGQSLGTWIPWLYRLIDQMNNQSYDDWAYCGDQVVKDGDPDEAKGEMPFLWFWDAKYAKGKRETAVRLLGKMISLPL
jgi:hypothetical protein